MRATLNSLNSPRKTVERIARTLVLLAEGFCLFCIFVNLLLGGKQFAAHVLVHEFVGIVYALGRGCRSCFATR